MKKIVNKLIIFLSVITLMTACEKDEVKAVIDNSAVPGLNLSTSSLTLDKESADANALTATWTAPAYGFNAGVQYRLFIDKAGNNFNDAQVFTTGTELSKSWTHQQLNNLILAMGFEVSEAANLEIAVESVLSDAVTQRSEILTVSAMPYLDKLDLSSTWGVVGSGAVNGWDGPDMPFYKTADAGVFVAYVMLNDGEIKIRENNDWAVNYGDTGADGSLEAGGDNIAVTAGTYAITFNANDLTYTIEPLSWGIVGSGAPNGWDGPDLEFMYDASSDQWRAIATLNDGEIKIRKNNDWGLNYGDTGADGTLEANGDNIAVSAGTYLVTLNLNDLSLVIEPISIPGVVGSGAPNGWDGPDVQFMPDFSREGFWLANNVTLVDGEIKFRMDNDWAVNYGDTGADGSLEAGGDNIAVSAGVYDIELDLSDTGPSYKMTAK